MNLQNWFIKKMLDQLTLRDNILLLINQVRQTGTSYTGAPIYEEPCGHAPRYYASVKLRFGTRTFTQGDKVDCRDGENADGFRLVFATTKNKTASTQRGGGFLTFRYDTGLDWVTDLLEVAIKYEFIKRPNNMTYILVNLERRSRKQQVSEGWFKNLDDVPEEAITMSVSQILSSKHIIVSCPDQRKAKAVAACLFEDISPLSPSSALRYAASCSLYLDRLSSCLVFGDRRTN